MQITIAPAADRAAALRRLVPVERHAVGGATVIDMCEGAELLDVSEDGRIIGTMAVSIDGDRATITAACGHGRRAGLELQMLEHMLKARGVCTVGAFTRRPGLVVRLVGAGYELTSAELVKRIA